MPKTVNPYWRKRLFIIAILLVALLVWLCSCNPTKKIERDDNKAVSRVEAKVELLNRVGEQYRQLKPCSNDTLITRIHDTTTNILTNTIRHTDTITKNGVKYIYVLDTAYFEKTKTIYQDKIVTDHELTNRQKDTINSLRLREAAFSGTIAEVRTNLAEQHKATNKWKLYFYLSLAFTVISHVVRTYIGGWFSSITSIFKKK